MIRNRANRRAIRTKMGSLRCPRHNCTPVGLALDFWPDGAVQVTQVETCCADFRSALEQAGAAARIEETDAGP